MRVRVTRDDFRPFVDAVQPLDSETQRSVASKGFKLLLDAFNTDESLQSVCLILVGDDCVLEADQVGEDLLLHDADFPDGFKDMAHPDDFVVEYFPHEGKNNHGRIIVRVCFQVSNGYLPLSFVCDTGASHSLYLSPRSYGILNDAKRILKDKDLCREYVQLSGMKASLCETPAQHQPANLIGIRLLAKLGLRMFLGDGDLKFDFAFPPNDGL
jgi:hypothetical protein